jgi:hypothetical protein
MSASLSYKDYTVGWICALREEVSAARAILDETHKLPLPGIDYNAYHLGRIESITSSSPDCRLGYLVKPLQLELRNG